MRQKYSVKVNNLLESKRPSLRILLEEEENKKEEKNKDKEKDKKDSSSDDLFADLDLGGKDQEEKNDKMQGEKEPSIEDNNPDMEMKDNNEESDESDEKDDEKMKKIVQDTLKKYEKTKVAVNFNKREFSDVLDQSLFGESFLRKSKLKDNFKLQEKRIFKIQKLLNENSLSGQLSELDVSVDELVNNAINLTKNFVNKVDIPELIMDHIASRFAEKAAEEEDESIASSYRVKLEEFIEKYLRKLVSVDDYKNYDASGYIIKNEPTMKTAVGARPTT